MIHVGIREAKMNLSKLLKRVTQGQEVIITDRGKPVGKIVPVPQDHLSLAERIKKIEKEGLLGPMRKGRAMRCRHRCLRARVWLRSFPRRTGTHES